MERDGDGKKDFTPKSRLRLCETKIWTSKEERGEAISRLFGKLSVSVCEEKKGSPKRNLEKIS